jgi:type I restriction enzyme M protein
MDGEEGDFLMAKTNTNTVSIGFEQQIWKAADILRGNMDAAEYKHVVLGLIFLKYISDKFEERYRELKAENDDVEDKDAYTEKLIFFVPPPARWEKIAEAAHREEIGTVIDNAMRVIEKENKSLKDILPKNYTRSELDKRRLGKVVDLFTNIKMIEHGTDKDILGRTYEYCLSKFAEQEGKRAGEFFTPSCVVRTLVEVLQPFKGFIYDPCCGSGGMFVQSGDFVKNHSGNIDKDLSIYGQDANPTTRKMALMNLAIRGIGANLGAYNADTFHNDLHPTLKAHFILANPPFNLSDWNDGSLNDDQRWKYGLPPSGNANFAWLQHMIHHLSPTGKIGMVLANGSLSSQTGGEGEIRRRIIEDDLVEGIIAMPTQLFYTTQIPVSLWFINRNKKQKGKTLFIDARKMGTMVNRRLREMAAEDIAMIASTFETFNKGKLEDVKGYCASVTTDDIAKQNFILTPGRYVGIEEQEDDGEPFEEKMTRLTGELSVMFKQGHVLEKEIKKRLGAIGYEV